MPFTLVLIGGGKMGGALLEGWLEVGMSPASIVVVEPYADTFLPVWSLWATGTAVPVVELVAGAMLLAGFQTRAALLALGAVLVLVTFGHLLADPLYAFQTHVIPRTALLLFVLCMPASEDWISVDGWLARRKGSMPLR